MGETERLYGILEARLKGRDWIVGPGLGRYSIADIALLGWISLHTFAAVSLDDFPAINYCLKRCWERPAVQRGFLVPKAHMFQPFKKLESDLAAKQIRLVKLVDEAKSRYNYKYSSP